MPTETILSVNIDEFRSADEKSEEGDCSRPFLRVGKRQRAIGAAMLQHMEFWTTFQPPSSPYVCGRIVCEDPVGPAPFLK